MDIVVYKHVKSRRMASSIMYGRDERVLLTTYRDFLVEIGKTYEADIKITEDNEIEEGLHSFKAKADCHADMLDEIRLDFRLNENDSMHLCKCVIPKGSSYYVGTFEKKPCYASDKLTYVELI